MRKKFRGRGKKSSRRGRGKALRTYTVKRGGGRL